MSVTAAQDVLHRYPELKGRERERYEAIIEGSLPEFCLHGFMMKRDNYSDELPDVDVRVIIDEDILDNMKAGRPPGSMLRYKCQTNYLFTLGGALKFAIEQEVIVDPEIIRQIHDFVNSDMNFSVGDPENVARIERINGILNVVISNLDQQVNPTVDEDDSTMIS